MLIVSGTNRTLPSPKAKLTPPAWWLTNPRWVEIGLSRVGHFLANAMADVIGLAGVGDGHVVGNLATLIQL